MRNGYQLLYESLRTRLTDCDLRASAVRMGLPAPVAGFIHYEFLGRLYLISNSGVYKTDERPDNINNRSLLIHYLLSEGNGEMAGEFVTMSNMTGMVPGQNLATDFFAQALIRELGKNYKGSLMEARQLGGILEDGTKSGEHHWHFQLLPKIPMKLIHYEPDDEFPLGFQYMFDRNSINIMEYECLAFLIGSFNHELISAVKSGNA